MKKSKTPPIHVAALKCQAYADTMNVCVPKINKSV